MKELDLLLLRYLRERHAAAASDERAAFVEFLELPDPDLVAISDRRRCSRRSPLAALCRARAAGELNSCRRGARPRSRPPGWLLSAAMVLLGVALPLPARIGICIGAATLGDCRPFA